MISFCFITQNTYCSLFFLKVILRLFLPQQDFARDYITCYITLLHITHKLIMLIALFPLKIQTSKHLQACDFTADATVCNTENGLKKSSQHMKSTQRNLIRHVKSDDDYILYNFFFVKQRDRINAKLVDSTDTDKQANKMPVPNSAYCCFVCSECTLFCSML